MTFSFAVKVSVTSNKVMKRILVLLEYPWMLDQTDFKN